MAKEAALSAAMVREAATWQAKFRLRWRAIALKGFMEPIILIHGYSAENKPENSIDEIYGSLRANLKKTFADSPVVGIDVTRYISLDDGVDLDDLSLSFDRALRAKYPKLLDPDFEGINVIIHSTGALVIRNWIRRHSPKPSPIKRIIHLRAPIWAAVGRTLAKRS